MSTTTRMLLLCRAVRASRLLAALVTTSAFAAEPLTDEQLDAITAGTDDSVLEEIVVHATRLTASGKTVTAEGTFELRRPADTRNGVDLLLRDSAQSDLQALVNINALQSLVNVLVNLNINIDSTVGEVRQINLSNGP